jgi:glycosyltransferase involved in cell wall biosynthesis
MIVYFGDTSLRRGTKDIILAAKVLEKDASIKFLIIGYNNKEQKVLESYIKKLDVKNVKLTGYMPFSEAVSYFKSASAGICPIHRNIHHDTTFANKIFQYMYFELPVIVSDCPPQQNVIETWNAGLVFESENSEDLVQQILKLKNSTNYRQMCLNAKESIIKQYNWNNASKELKNLYIQIDN